MELSYYATFQEYAGGKAAKKRLTLSAASTVKTTGYFNPNDVEITIKAGKVLYFYPDTKREQEDWVAAINAEIDKLAAAAKPIGMQNHCKWLLFSLSCDWALGASIDGHWG